jgi:hypothetical protein
MFALGFQATRGLFSNRAAVRYDCARQALKRERDKFKPSKQSAKPR